MKRKPKVNWQAMPAWAKWVVKGPTGRWWWIRNNPIPADPAGWWIPDDDVSAGLIPNKYSPRWPGDWRDSLCKRPAKGAKR